MKHTDLVIFMMIAVNAHTASAESENAVFKWVGTVPDFEIEDQGWNIEILPNENESVDNQLVFVIDGKSLSLVDSDILEFEVHDNQDKQIQEFEYAMQYMALGVNDYPTRYRGSYFEITANDKHVLTTRDIDNPQEHNSLEPVKLAVTANENVINRAITDYADTIIVQATVVVADASGEI